MVAWRASNSDSDAELDWVGLDWIGVCLVCSAWVLGKVCIASCRSMPFSGALEQQGGSKSMQALHMMRSLQEKDLTVLLNALSFDNLSFLHNIFLVELIY